MGAIWTFLRLCGIVVGVATLLRLATLGLGVEYKEVFQAFLDQVRNVVELGFLIDPLEKFAQGALEWLRGFGWRIPDLAPHWRPVLTLEWLLMASYARNLTGIISIPLFWAAVSAVIAAVATGTQPLASSAIFFWPLAGFALFAAGLAIPGTNRFAEINAFRGGSWTDVFGWLVACSLFILAGHLLSPETLGGPPALVLLACLVGGWGILFLLYGLVQRFEDPDRNAMNTGLDILGVMGLALAIGYVMMK